MIPGSVSRICVGVGLGALLAMAFSTRTNIFGLGYLPVFVGIGVVAMTMRSRPVTPAVFLFWALLFIGLVLVLISLAGIHWLIV